MRAPAVAAVLVLILGLVAVSTPRHVGDSGEYLAMSMNLTRLSRPSLTAADLAGARDLIPGEAGVRVEKPQFRAPDGRQDLPHFWFYPLLAAPFVRAALVVGADPLIGFTALNILLLLALTILLSTRLSPAALLLVVASPVVWWIDKAHTEVFTFSLIAGALFLLRHAPWWSIVAFGTAATQNPPMALAMLMAITLALHGFGWRDRRVWIASTAGAILASLHPLYYYARLGTWSGLADAIDRHWPSVRELATVAFDPNVGIFAHAPFLLLAIIIAVVAMLQQSGARLLDPPRATMLLVAVLFVLSFTQTANVNSGGTPGPSRYGLWLIPFAIPILGGIQPQARWLRVVAAASVAWSVWTFAPARSEGYLRPSALASYLWEAWPGIDNPLAEVFAERVSGHEPATPPLATAGCEKILLIGDGSGAVWPARCTSAALPAFCQQTTALCYANARRGTYRFEKAPATPAWRAGVARAEPDLSVSVERMLAVTQRSPHGGQIAMWHDEGWSYPERLATPAPGDRFREWRWIDQRAQVGVTSDAPIAARMKLAVRAFNVPRRLRISIEGREVATLLVTTTPADYTTSDFNLSAGRTLIALESMDGSDAPNTTDLRRLSFQVFRIDLVAVR